MDEWIDINSRKYFRTCEKCRQEIVIEQSGDDLPEEVLRRILSAVHVENTYESFLQYVKVGDKWLKIDVEISQRPCIA